MRWLWSAGWWWTDINKLFVCCLYHLSAAHHLLYTFPKYCQGALHAFMSCLNYCKCSVWHCHITPQQVTGCSQWWWWCLISLMRKYNHITETALAHISYQSSTHRWSCLCTTASTSCLRLMHQIMKLISSFYSLRN